MYKHAIFGVLTLCLVCGVTKSARSSQQQQQNQHQVQQPVFPSDDEYIPLINSGLRDNFEWQLLKELSYTTKGNTIISPISIKILLALLYEGASGNTESDLKNILELNNKTEVRQIYSKILDSLTAGKPRGCDAQDITTPMSRPGKTIRISGSANNRKAGPAQEIYTLNIGTRIYIDDREKLEQQFQSKACNSYQTAMVPTNFSNPQKASTVINEYVNRLTNGKIDKIVDTEDIANSMMLLVNALYFRGYWSYQFPREKSHRGGFYLVPSRTVQVDYMATTEYYFYVESASLDAKIIRIPYKGKKFSMIVILPNAKAGLEQLLEQININKLRREIASMDRRSVDLVLPKFVFDYQTRMSNVLKNMGLKSLFDNTASLPGIVRDNEYKLQVSDVIQKAGIEVNEEGSTASASSAIEIGNKFGDAQAMFNATHPFVFYIEDQVGQSLLFLGKVTNPLEHSSQPLPPRFADDPPGGAIGNAPTQASNLHYPQQPHDEQQYAQTVPALLPPPSYSESGAGSTYSSDDDSVSMRFNYFDLDLLGALAATSSPHENIFVSPASIKSTLGMILEGAKGKSATEIANLLRLQQDPQYIRDQLKQLLYDLSVEKPYTKLFSANGIFVSDKLRLVGAYQNALQDFYKAQIQLLNFDNVGASTQAINQWVSKASKGLIPTIVGPENINQDSSVILANAMYFKSIWKYAFDPKMTSVRCFHLPSGQCQQSYMMRNTAELRYKMIGEVNAHALEIPYNDDYAMLVLVPMVKHNTVGLIRDLAHTTFNTIVDKLEKTEVVYEIPQFDIDYTVPLRGTLQKLQIREIFGPDANLSGIVHGERVHVDNIVHKAKIEVNEQGTIAAAATAAVVIPLMGSSAPQVVANHPFAFFIYKIANRNIIFEGIVNQPKMATSTPQTQAHPVPVSTVSRSYFPQTYQPQTPSQQGQVVGSVLRTVDSVRRNLNNPRLY